MARREFHIFVNGQDLPFCAEPTYLGTKLDRALTFRRHLQSLRKKLISCVGHLKQLAGSSWGADATILRTAILALIHFTAEYCAPVWCRSAHTRLIGKPINNTLQIVTGCLSFTPTDNLLFYQACNQLSFDAKKPYCLGFAALRNQNIFYIKGFYLHMVDGCGNLNQDTHFCLLHWNCRTIPPGQAPV